MDRLIDQLHRLTWFAEDLRDGLLYRYVRTEVICWISNAVALTEPFFLWLSYVPGGWRPYIWASDLGTSLFDAWVLSGRDWEHCIRDARPDTDRRWHFFLGSQGPETSSERSIRMSRECRAAHHEGAFE